MPDGGRTSKPGSTTDAPRAAQADPEVLPPSRDRGELFGPARFDFMRRERAEAATQLRAGMQREPAVQRSGPGGKSDAAETQRAAREGVKGAGSSLPHAETIQRSFGPGHDVSGVRAFVGGSGAKASERIGADAYASGDAIAFRNAPDVRTAAHEAAHVVQQRQGVQLSGGVGQVGDHYERQADAVADRVAAGKSASDLLPKTSGGGAAGAVQRQAAPQPARDDAHLAEAVQVVERAMARVQAQSAHAAPAANAHAAAPAAAPSPPAPTAAGAPGAASAPAATAAGAPDAAAAPVPQPPEPSAGADGGADAQPDAGEGDAADASDAPPVAGAAAPPASAPAATEHAAPAATEHAAPAATEHAAPAASAPAAHGGGAAPGAGGDDPLAKLQSGKQALTSLRGGSQPVIDKASAMILAASRGDPNWRDAAPPAAAETGDHAPVQRAAAAGALAPAVGRIVASNPELLVFFTSPAGLALIAAGAVVLYIMSTDPVPVHTPSISDPAPPLPVGMRPPTMIGPRVIPHINFPPVTGVPPISVSPPVPLPITAAPPIAVPRAVPRAIPRTRTRRRTRRVLPIDWPFVGGLGLPIVAPNPSYNIVPGKQMAKVAPMRDPSVTMLFRERHGLRPDEVAHHMHPLFLGGADNPGNLVRMNRYQHTDGHTALNHQPHLVAFGAPPNLLMHPIGTLYRVRTII